MRALILAAGMGMRLAPITNNIPKSLIPVNGKPILMKQLENLYLNGITDITVVSGYKAKFLETTVHAVYPSVKIIESIDYETTNNMYSAFLGRVNVYGEAFLMMNADVFFDASVITELLICEASNAIVTDIGTYFEESMKVVEKGGRLVEISKSIAPEAALGSSIDVYKFSSEGGRAFFSKCFEYINVKKQLKLWSEVALNDILPEIEFKACELNGRWCEIDNYEDLAAAEKLFAE